MGLAGHAERSCSSVKLGQTSSRKLWLRTLGGAAGHAKRSKGSVVGARAGHGAGMRSGGREGERGRWEFWELREEQRGEEKKAVKRMQESFESFRGEEKKQRASMGVGEKTGSNEGATLPAGDFTREEAGGRIMSCLRGEEAAWQRGEATHERFHTSRGEVASCRV